MGVVYLAHDDDLDRDVALKIPSLEGDKESFLKWFQREARAGASSATTATSAGSSTSAISRTCPI